MAIYKRYNGRRRRANKGFILWLCCILTVFLLTAIVGFFLGRKAKNVTIETLPIGTENVGGDSLTPMAEQKFHGLYVAPEKLTEFTSDDPNAYASVWLYRNGEAQFATEVDAKLGKAAKSLPAAEFSANGGQVSGIFEVTYLYADPQIREVTTAYEQALLAEFAAKAPAEIVLVFRDAAPEHLGEMLALAKSLPVRVALCVPYSVLRDGTATRFFIEAENADCPAALLAEGVKATGLREDVTEFGFYFTRYRVRLLLTEAQAELAEVLAEESADCWQFLSQNETEETE